MDTNSQRDPELWELAKKRAGFKRHLTTYIIINVFLWVLWYFNGRDNDSGPLPWPAWTTLGWGIGVVLHYFGAYVTTGITSEEKEYQKLKNQS